MSLTDNKINLLGLAPRALEDWFLSQGEKPFRARQLMRWVYQRGVTSFGEMSDLSKGLRAKLADVAALGLPPVQSRHDAADGTIKWLFASGNGQSVEAVYIPEPARGTLCISSQLGCALDCAFCATGHQGFNRNLTAAEIVGQVWQARQRLPPRPNGESAITNVVFMGMGEPLANYRAVLPALEILLADSAFGLSRRRVTVSTSGIVPHIHRLAADCNVSLAVSLHAPTDELRDVLVPINRLHLIDELLDACWRYAAEHTHRYITFEYVMLRGINDAPEHADALVRLLKGKPAKINLIPFNPFPGTAYRRSPADRIRHFQERLRRHRLIATTRRTRGEDIDAACGQLAGRVSDRLQRRLGERSRPKAPAARRFAAGRDRATA